MPALPFLRGVVVISTVALLCVSGPAAAQGANIASPAARPVPKSSSAVDYAAADVAAGRIRFGADCAFCHGRDATGGAGGSDLTRSDLVAQDVRGDRIGAVLREGRADKGMPAFASLAADDLDAIVAFLHTQQQAAAAQSGGRRSVDLADLQTGDAAAGGRYFATHCRSCHTGPRDLAGIAGRLEGLALLRRMLYPRGGLGSAPGVRPTATIQTATGETITGPVSYRDEFTITIGEGATARSWSTDAVHFTIDDPLAAHAAQLARYTDRDMHDVLAYLHTLR
jgi:cytochrome c oxidase cbb3-type subunit 3